MKKNIEIFYNLLKQDKLKNIVIIIQIIISVFASTFLLVPIVKKIETTKIIRESDVKKDISFFTSNFNLLISPKTFFNENYEKIKKFVRDTDGVNDFGTVYLIPNKEKEFNVVLYDKLVYENIKLQLQRGDWFNEDKQYEKGVIPVVVSDALKNKYIINSEFDVEILEYSTNSFRKVTCKVIGILQKETYIYYGSSNHTDPSVSDLFMKSYANESIVIMPNILDFEPEYVAKDGAIIKYEPSKLNNVKERIDVAGIGKVNTLEDLQLNDNNNIILYNESQLYQFIIVYIFIIMSIGGYTILTSLNYKRLLTIYYICGLTWRKGLKYITIKNILLIMVPTILSSIFSNTIVCHFKTIYTFNIKVIIITALMYGVIALLVSILTGINLRKYKPSEFLKEVD